MHNKAVLIDNYDAKQSCVTLEKETILHFFPVMLICENFLSTLLRLKLHHYYGILFKKLMALASRTQCKLKTFESIVRIIVRRIKVKVQFHV